MNKRMYEMDITIEKCQEFIDTLSKINPENQPICPAFPTVELIKSGGQSMRTDNFVISRGIKDVQ